MGLRGRHSRARHTLTQPLTTVLQHLGITSRIVLALILGQSPLGHAAAAQPEPPASSASEGDTPASNDSAQPDSPLFSFLDVPQQAVASRLNRMATAMDEFFADERVYYTDSGSYIRLTLDAIQEEGGERGYRGDVKLKLRLPRTQEKLKLTFESNPVEERDPVDSTLEESPAQAAEEKNYYAGIQATLGDEKKWRFRPGVGIKFREPIDVYARVRADRSYRAGEWLFRPSQTFYTFKESGFGSDTAFELDYQLTPHLLFRSRSFIRYTDENDYYEPSQVFSLLHAISRHRGMAYQIGVYGITEPIWHATDYLAQIRYRQNVHSDYLFLELIPRVIYQREDDFDPEHTLTLRLEMVFQG